MNKVKGSEYKEEIKNVERFEEDLEGDERQNEKTLSNISESERGKVRELV